MISTDVEPSQTKPRHDESVGGGSESQGVRRHHPSVLHHSSRQGLQVAEELLGLTGAQQLNVPHDPVVGLKDGEDS